MKRANLMLLGVYVNKRSVKDVFRKFHNEPIHMLSAEYFQQSSNNVDFEFLPLSATQHSVASVLLHQLNE